MNTYGWLLLGEALLALFALGLCGGWVLVPFRRAERPYLWLAAPLTGLFTFGGALALWYCGAHFPFRGALWAALVPNAAGTVWALARHRPGRPPRGAAIAGCVAVLAAAYWGTFSCNRASIDAREPAVAAIDGSDMFGYALVADWMRAHPFAAGPHPTDPLDGLAHYNLRKECSRPVTFALLGAAAEARGTSGLFAYDWAAGVILAAALLGFAGLFAEGPVVLAALVAGAALSSWYTNARTGFMGKSVGYPGGLLLVGLLLAALAEPSRARWGALAVLTAAVAWALSPTFPPALFVIVLGGYAVALAAGFVRGKADGPRPGFGRGVARPLLAAAVAAAVVSGPWLVLHKLAFGTFNPPAPPTDWGWVLPVALDLDMPSLPAVPARGALLYATAALAAVGLVAGAWRRNGPAVALLACGLFVPACRALGVPHVYTFHGLIYPLTLAGAALLVRREPAPGAPRGAAVWAAGALALLVATIAVRVPQARASAKRYLFEPPPHRVVHRASEARELRAAIGPDDVDVALAHWADNHLAWAELAAHGVPVRFRSPGWNVSVGAYRPDAERDGPKARFALLERGAWSAPGTVRWTGKRLKLVEDRHALAAIGIEWPVAVLWDPDWRPAVWLGPEPTAFRLHNGTGTAREVWLVADTAPGPARADEGRTLMFRTGDARGTRPVTVRGATAIPLRLAPGWNRVELSVAEPPDAPAGPPVPLVHFANWRIEPR